MPAARSWQSARLAMGEARQLFIIITPGLSANQLSDSRDSPFEVKSPCTSNGHVGRDMRQALSQVQVHYLFMERVARSSTQEELLCDMRSQA